MNADSDEHVARITRVHHPMCVPVCPNWGGGLKVIRDFVLRQF
jgi:hypothetical protein